jgi:hypothetical protein
MQTVKQFRPTPWRIRCLVALFGVIALVGLGARAAPARAAAPSL